MSNRNRDDREYEERQQAQQQHNRPQAWAQQQGHYARPRGNEADDRDVQGNFSSGGYGSQSYGANRGYEPSQGSMGGSAYESAYGLRGQEPQGYGLQGHGSQGYQSYGPQSYGAPSSGAGSQGFGPEGYGTPQYEGRGGYESRFASQDAPGYGQGGGLREFGPQGPYQQYGLQGHDIPRRDTGLSGSSQRPYQGESFGREFGRELPQWSGQQSRSPLEERSHLGYGQPAYGSQGLRTQQPLYGQQGQQGFEPGMRTSHRGLGPKNYTRSDERIREDLNERLTDADDIDARGLTVEVSNGVATLSGTVEQRWMKHRAEDIAESCSGVRDVNNQIRVQTLHHDSGIAGQGSGKTARSTGSGIGGSAASAQGGTTGASSSSSTGSAGSSTSSGSSGSSTRPGGSTGAGH